MGASSPWWTPASRRVVVENLTDAETAAFLGAVRAGELPPKLQSLVGRKCKHLSEWPAEAAGKLPRTLRHFEVTICKLKGLPDLRGLPALESVERA